MSHPSPLTRCEWVACVAARLGYPGAVPHELYLRIEAVEKTGASVNQAVSALMEATK